jgi:hypothetical protein
LPNGVWPSPLALFFGAFFISTGLNYIYFYEAFLGIEPHWDPFCFLFRVKPQPTSKNLSIVGGASFQLRQQDGDRYLSYKFPSNISRWKNHLFYIENHAPQLPEKSGKPPVVRPEWNTELPKVDLDQVDELLAIIAAHKQMSLSSSARSSHTNNATP